MEAARAKANTRTIRSSGRFHAHDLSPVNFRPSSSHWLRSLRRSKTRSRRASGGLRGQPHQHGVSMATKTRSVALRSRSGSTRVQPGMSSPVQKLVVSVLPKSPPVATVVPATSRV